MGHTYKDGSRLEPSSALFKWIERNWASLEKVEVKGKLAKHYSAWQALTSDKLLLSVVKDGYAPPFKRDPPQFYKKNNLNARKEPDFVRKAVAEL